VITSVKDEIKDSLKAISSAIELMDIKHDQMQEDLNLIKNELYVANLRSFASKVKDAFVCTHSGVGTAPRKLHPC
jgi:hypothetical protein